MQTITEERGTYLKMMPGPYDKPSDLRHAIIYALWGAGATHGYVGGIGVDPEEAIEQMRLVKELYGKTEGRQIRHFYMSFGDNLGITAEEALKLGYKIAEYYGGRYQIVFGVHENTGHIHVHFVMNTVSYIDGKMYAEGFEDYQNLCRYASSVTLVAVSSLGRLSSGGVLTC